MKIREKMEVTPFLNLITTHKTTNAALTEAVTILVSQCQDIDVTIISIAKNYYINIISSTISDEETLSYIEDEFVQAVENRTIIKNKFFHGRLDVKKTTIIPLIFNRNVIGYCLVEEHKNGFSHIAEKELVPIIQIITYLVHVWQLESYGMLPLGKDTLTAFYTRDAFIHDLKLICKNDEHVKKKEDVCIAIIHIQNITELNDKFGMIYVDALLLKVAAVIKRNFKSHMYRYGGTKFSLIIFKDDMDSYDVLSNLLDELMNISIELSVSIVYSPLSEKTNFFETLSMIEQKLSVLTDEQVAIVRNFNNSGTCSDMKKEDKQLGNVLRNVQYGNLYKDEECCS